MVEAPRSEALPRWTVKRRGHARSASDDRSRHEPPRAGAHRESPAPGLSGLPRSLLGLTVVVVDDDESTLEYFAFALRACGAVVATASTALDGLRLVEAQRPDVVLSDIAMVGYDGYWLVREIRELGARVSLRVPVVATTAYGREHSRDRTLAAGFSEHLAKPVDPEVLCQTIAKAAGR